MRRGRDLVQMRCALPITGEVADLLVRPFRPGVDESAWLEVNNRAFRGHPEQGSWDLATLVERESQPWFDPNGFLLHEVEGRLAGFCWTKIHEPDEGVLNEGIEHELGEIYVIAVDPDFQGRGLGRQLVLAGLAFLSGRGVGTGDAVCRPRQRDGTQALLLTRVRRRPRGPCLCHRRAGHGRDSAPTKAAGCRVKPPGRTEISDERRRLSRYDLTTDRGPSRRPAAVPCRPGLRRPLPAPGRSPRS